MKTTRKLSHLYRALLTGICMGMIIVLVMMIHTLLVKTASANPIVITVVIPDTSTPVEKQTEITNLETPETTSNHSIWTFLLALLLAWLVEIPVMIVMMRFLFRLKTIPILRMVLVGALMTLVTLPILWYVLPLFMSGLIYVLMGEALVILAEAAMIKFGLKIDFSKALLISFVANLLSFLAGLLIF
jgi:hypothetical protein